ncbi:MAG: ribbon-helix-helix domain-containing protein [Candidatus Bathyarchaeia archaeon]
MTQKLKAPRRKIIPLRVSEDLVRSIDAARQKLNIGSRSEFIREAIGHYTSYVDELQIIQIRDLPKEQAKREILEYLMTKDRAWTDEVANELRLDLALVNECLMELWQEGRVE